MNGNKKTKNNFEVKSCDEVNDRMSLREIRRGNTAFKKMYDFPNLTESPYTATVSAIQNNIVDAGNNVSYHLMISAAN